MRKVTWLSFLLLLSLPGLDQAQRTSITGLVTAAKGGGGLPGVTILVRGTPQGTSSGADGTYSIAVPDTAALIFCSIGYDAQTVRVRTQTVINVALAENAQALNEVVVKGLNVTRECRSLSYSVTEVRG